jgi:transposase
MAQVQVISGVERRRQWSEAEKRAVVAAAFAPGVVVTEVSRQLDINTGLIYRWRRELEESAQGFAEVVVAPPASGEVSEHRNEAIEIVLAGATQIRIPLSSPANLAAAVVKAAIGR